MRPILGKPMLERQIERIRRCQKFATLVVATSSDPSDAPLAALCTDLGVACFRGSLDNVLDRFYHAALPLGADTVVRLTGDCPLFDPALADDIIQFYQAGDFDYASNTLEPTFPDGLDVEVFGFSALETAWREARLGSELEHVTPFIHRRPDRFRLGNYRGAEDLSHLRWTVDEEADFQLVTRIFAALYPHRPDFTREHVLALLRQNPSWTTLNEAFQRNEGLQESLKRDQAATGRSQEGKSNV